MMCWYCHWGWPKPIADIYDQYVRIAGESAMHYGPAHIVWDDENFERCSVQWCLDHFDDVYASSGENTVEELAAVRASLVKLVALPDSILDMAEPYHSSESGDIADFPPPAGMIMVRR